MSPWLLVSGDFVKTGGMDRANFALASYLARQGEEVHLVAHRADEALLASGNVTLHRAAKPLNSYYLGRKKIDTLGRRVGRTLAQRGGRVIVNGGNCLWGDVNWVHYVHAAYEPQMAGGTLRRLTNLWKRQAFLAEERRALALAKLVIANSQRTRQDLVQHLHLDAAKVRCAYYGIDPDSFRVASNDERLAARSELGWPGDRPVALFVGALGDRRKAFDTVFQAWRILKRENGWDAMLAVIGQGAELDEWKERTRLDGLSEQIQFLGFRSDVPRVLRAVDLLVAPARYEAYGLAVHEALCCGVPAIVSSNSGVCERLCTELRDLLLDDPDDAAQLATRLRYWNGSRQRLRAVMLGFAQTLGRWTWNHMAQELVRLVSSRTDSGQSRPMAMMA